MGIIEQAQAEAEWQAEFAARKAAWLRAHPGDFQGALDYAFEKTPPCPSQFGEGTPGWVKVAIGAFDGAALAIMGFQAAPLVAGALAAPQVAEVKASALAAYKALKAAGLAPNLYRLAWDDVVGALAEVFGMDKLKAVLVVLKRWLPVIGSALVAGVVVLKALGMEGAAAFVETLYGYFGYVGSTDVTPVEVGAAVVACSGIVLKIWSQIQKALKPAA